ncbi:MAG TPA: presqualene diphosphate synthase HpnD [Bacteroidota bacterium]|jgi:phytoene synthase|nr:presqualene diphosphate synthase HpnD [Bacteroidota bacterium]
MITAFSPEAVLRPGRSSFQYSFSFLPKTQRDALKTVYTFCRVTDDIVDNKEDVVTNIDRLKKWRTELERALDGRSEYPLLNQLSSIARRFNIPVVHFHELVKGVEMDLVKNRYETFAELQEYCYLVASSVGLMCLGIFGSRDERTREYAVNLGIALQLTNILRDVGVDASYGRVYLPSEDLRRFNVSQEDLLNSRYSPEFRQLMEFEAARAEEYFTRARAALPAGEKRSMFAAKIMERIYFHTLIRIREEQFDVFSKSVSLPRTLQLLIAIKYWVKQRLFGR